ncbi:MAG: hypothetical protein J0I24_12305 [Thiomonas arsenitoxydans]|uniref:Uncharacterized protein n=1 Tax=Thiomonas arsenitoxydans (strain DSM 22701 / CIP 110005 / 3As) TaxID=426114 RepID=A0A8I1SWV5_THIA3|nr:MULTISPECIES: hypothetical protein [Thiomonas]MBN8745073.1 hypothetical protein [Thiomonas arsenitoxydans]ODU95748.1 MAG: hypothetical protein ABT24_11310 [Thiomonas sp. SCN 64-16]
MAPLRTPQAARVRLSAVLQQALGAHDQWLFDLQGWQDRAQAARRARTSFNAPKPRVPPPLLIQASTGLGKSYQIAQIAAQRQTPLLFLTATRDLRDAFVAAVGQAGGQAQAYSGRAHAPGQPHHCQRIEDGRSLAAKRRIQQPLLCRRCKHGLREQRDFYRAVGSDRQLARIQSVIESAGFHEEIERTTACNWIAHQRDTRSAPIVAAHYASFSSALAQWRQPILSADDLNPPDLPRLIVIDETPPLAQTVTITSEDIAQWSAQLGPAIERARADQTKAELLLRMAEREESRKLAQADIKDANRRLASCKAAQDLLPLLAHWIAESAHAADDRPIDPQPGVQQWAQDRLVTIQDGAALWEAAHIDSRHNAGDWVIPLRAAAALGFSLRLDSAFARSGSIQCVAPTPLGEAIASGKHPVLLLDATAPRIIQHIVRAHGGTVEEIRVKQNLHLNIYADTPRLRKDIRSNQEALQQRVTEVRAARQLAADEQMTDAQHIGVLTFEPVAERLGGMARRVGHWFAHERGTNAFEDRDLVVFGEPLEHPHAQRANYLGERAMALAAGAAETDWPRWDAARAPAVFQGRRSAIRLPTHPALRDWAADQFRQRLLQAVGRVRAVSSQETRTVWLWAASAIVVDWEAQTGIAPQWRASPAEFRHNKGRGLGTQAANTAKEQATLRKLVEAFRVALAGGVVPSRRVCAVTMRPEAYAKHRDSALRLALHDMPQATLRRLAGLKDRRAEWAIRVALQEIARLNTTVPNSQVEPPTPQKSTA